jgi:CheY-like chemotaxis protein
MSAERLLVVDESPTVLHVVESTLARAGHSVETLRETAEMVARARIRPPAAFLIATDLGATSDGAGRTLRVCTELAKDPVLSQVPVILMTGRTESPESGFAALPNIADYVRKPFSPDALLTVVGHVLTKKLRGVGPRGDTANNPGVDGAVTSLAPSPALAEVLLLVPRPDPGEALRALRATMAERVERHRQETGGWQVEELFAGALDDVTLEALLAKAGYFPTGEGGPGGPALAGDLAAISMTEVLSLLRDQRQTGTLRVFGGAARIEVTFRDGRIDFASSVGVAEEFLLGRFAVESGALETEKLAEVMTERAGMASPPWLGEDLVARGLITAARLREAMVRQTSELVFEMLRWPNGSFYFRRTVELPRAAKQAALAISVDALLLEGFRRVDEWRVIERAITSFDQVFVRNDARIESLAPGTLTREEIVVLDLVNGKQSVRDVIRTAKLGSFDVNKILYRFLRSDLIRPRMLPTVVNG